MKKIATGSTLGLVTVKMSTSDRKHIEGKAKQFAEGNLSAWIRHAAQAYTPKRGEKVSIKPQ